MDVVLKLNRAEEEIDLVRLSLRFLRSSNSLVGREGDRRVSLFRENWTLASAQNALRKLEYSTHNGVRRHEAAGLDAIVQALCIAFLERTE